MSLFLCPTGCGRQRQRGHLMCVSCWHKVPAHLRRQVYRTWQAVEGTTDQAAYDAYDAARSKAIASVRL